MPPFDSNIDAGRNALTQAIIGQPAGGQALDPAPAFRFQDYPGGSGTPASVPYSGPRPQFNLSPAMRADTTNIMGGIPPAPPTGQGTGVMPPGLGGTPPGMGGMPGRPPGMGAPMGRPGMGAPMGGMGTPPMAPPMAPPMGMGTGGIGAPPRPFGGTGGMFGAGRRPMGGMFGRR